MELISKDDAIAVAMYSKDPVEGIKNLPTVDPAAEVARCLVRCKECKYVEDEMSAGVHFCKFKMIGVVKPEGFCSYGVRKDLGV